MVEGRGLVVLPHKIVDGQRWRRLRGLRQITLGLAFVFLLLHEAVLSNGTSWFLLPRNRIFNILSFFSNFVPNLIRFR